MHIFICMYADAVLPNDKRRIIVNKLIILLCSFLKFFVGGENDLKLTKGNKPKRDMEGQ